MPWHPLRDADPSGPPKLANLRLGARRKLNVPETLFALRDETPLEPPVALGPAPWILRSAALSEDGASGSRAGQFESRIALHAEDYAEARRAVLDSMAGESPRSCLFAQQLLKDDAGLRAGVVFFDGFYYESATAEGGNQELTAGTARGDVQRGCLERGDPFSAWLERTATVFRALLKRAPALDLEFIDRGPGVAAKARFVLLQARPALFPLAPNRTLTLANHREILGDPPSPWIASALDLAGRRAPDFFAGADPEIKRWNEPYAQLLVGRAWLNLSLFQRIMDRWGLPRTFITEGVGGEGRAETSASAADENADGRIVWRRFLCSAPRLVKLQARSVWRTLRRGHDLERFEREVESADNLRALFAASVTGLETALKSNFAINGVWTGIARLRDTLRIRGSARVVTDRMRSDYEALRKAPRALRSEGLERWLRRYGHRGPLESDLARPRFRELRATLRAELEAAPEADAPNSPLPPLASDGGWNPLFWIDRVRESFRDELMRRFEPLRARLLEEAQRLVDAGHLEQAGDVFLLTADDVRLALPALRGAVERRRQALEAVRELDLPGTTTADNVREIQHAGGASRDGEQRDAYRGISLTPARFEGRVLRANDLVQLLQLLGTDPSAVSRETVLVVPALEPSWAVVFDRVGGVVAELGGELSHASILLREAAKPAVVNLPGIYRALADGDRVRLDGAASELTILERQPR